MTYKEQNRIIIMTYVVGISLNILLDSLFQGFPTMGSISGSIKVTTLLTAWWLFYFYWGWRLPYLRRLLFRMNFNGTWFGRYESISSANEKYSGDIAIRIQQSYLTISVISLTENYQNFSYSELIKFDEKSNTHGINYTYSQKENSLFDVAQRNGTSELTLKLINGASWLDGIFWTIHGTKGSIRVKRISDRQIDSFAEALETAKADKR